MFDLFLGGYGGEVEGIYYHACESDYNCYDYAERE